VKSTEYVGALEVVVGNVNACGGQHTFAWAAVNSEPWKKKKKQIKR
jgi:hypothetical protein